MHSYLGGGFNPHQDSSLAIIILYMVEQCWTLKKNTWLKPPTSYDSYESYDSYGSYGSYDGWIPATNMLGGTIHTGIIMISVGPCSDPSWDGAHQRDKEEIHNPYISWDFIIYTSH